MTKPSQHLAIRVYRPQRIQYALTPKEFIELITVDIEHAIGVKLGTSRFSIHFTPKQDPAEERLEFNNEGLSDNTIDELILLGYDADTPYHNWHRAAKRMFGDRVEHYMEKLFTEDAEPILFFVVEEAEFRKYGGHTAYKDSEV